MSSRLGNWLEFEPNLPPRKSFVGTLQTGFDSTSLGCLQECPRKYYYSIVCGVVPASESVHLKFGLALHSALEAYARARAKGANHDGGIAEAVRTALILTWEPRLNRGWISDHESKNRFNLVRTVLDYFDHYNPDAEALTTVILPNGDPAVELSFTLKTNYETQGGINYQLCGHLDRLVQFNDHYLGLDHKSTSMPFSDKYWQQFKPNTQVYLYTFAGQIIFPSPIKGFMIDGIRITPNETEFQRREITLTSFQVDEWYKDLGYWLAFAETCSKQNYWPMNTKSCTKPNTFGTGALTCEYIEICSGCPKVRDTWTKTGFVRRNWDPMEARGEF
jgi:hypothetical protein